jgi:hypothetical protein
MPKHNKTLTAVPPANADIERRVEQAIVSHMARNDGKMPTIAQLNVDIRTSNSKLCPAAKAVKARIMATQTKLAAMPDIPEELSLAHQHVLDQMWAKASEFQNEEIR